MLFRMPLPCQKVGIGEAFIKGNDALLLAEIEQRSQPLLAVYTLARYSMFAIISLNTIGFA